ncbi:hypothetical protein FUAX_04390 [Fulvitalea axinellae]|uniref:Glycosyltransferase 2-like domain-containing protein n=1 Tax=Fulvitalea axinellae TaxID=1182444 RepID=A0AAU9CJG1_9BACT|nr:hypothetical protein FUAX_04390 [Fulvitalea axinellae]
MEGNKNSGITVIIPTYNREKVLSRAISSVVRQTYSDWKLIVVDDASDDGTLELLELWKKRDPRIDYIRHSENMGNGCGARNTGILATATEFIALLDSDDSWGEHHLEFLVKAIERHPEASGVFSGSCVRTEERELSKHPAHKGYASIRHMLIGAGFGGSNSGVLVRREAFVRAGMYDLSLKKKTDMDMWLRIALQGKWIPVKGCFANIYVDADNRMAAHKPSVFKGKAQYFFKHRSKFREYGVEHIALRKLAREAVVNVGSIRLANILLGASQRANFWYGWYARMYGIKIWLLYQRKKGKKL